MSCIVRNVEDVLHEHHLTNRVIIKLQRNAALAKWQQLAAV
jgi:hypothetical protein